MASMAEFDFAIRGGRIVDGTGNPWYRADVGIKEGRIAQHRAGRRGRRRADDRGRRRVVCPGFIDMHTHSDVPLLKDGDAQSKVRQGVTLDVIGESTTVAPLVGPAAEEFRRELSHRDGFEAVDWTDFTGYFARLMRQGIALNVVSGVSPQQVKRAVVGFENRPATRRRACRDGAADRRGDGAGGDGPDLRLARRRPRIPRRGRGPRAGRRPLRRLLRRPPRHRGRRDGRGAGEGAVRRSPGQHPRPHLPSQGPRPARTGAA